MKTYLKNNTTNNFIGVGRLLTEDTLQVICGNNVLKFKLLNLPKKYQMPALDILIIGNNIEENVIKVSKASFIDSAREISFKDADKKRSVFILPPEDIIGGMVNENNNLIFNADIKNKNYKFSVIKYNKMSFLPYPVFLEKNIDDYSVHHLIQIL